jgi:hypothetical protein
MLFQAVMKFLSRLVEFKILVNWGMVHFRHLGKECAEISYFDFDLKTNIMILSSLDLGLLVLFIFFNIQRFFA